jgi:hypothetical protein
MTRLQRDAVSAMTMSMAQRAYDNQLPPDYPDADDCSGEDDCGCEDCIAEREQETEHESYT